MSFDLTILATTPDTSDGEIRAQALRCAAGRDHPEGNLDARIAAFSTCSAECTGARVPAGWVEVERASRLLPKRMS